MSTEDRKEAARRIRQRARALPADGAWQESTTLLDIVTSLADGTRSLADLDDEMFAQCVEAHGLDAVLDAATAGAAQRRAERVRSPLAFRPSAARPAAAYAAWVALAASLTLAVSVAWWWRRPIETTTSSQAATQAAMVATLEWVAPPPAEWSRSPILPGTTLPRQLPNFDAVGGTLGAGSAAPIPGAASTVIVRSERGWGEGVLIVGDGWLLTTYSTVATTVQTAAVSGQAAHVEIIAAQRVNGRLRPRSPASATIYRVDPARNLALLKIDALPPQSEPLEYARLGDPVARGATVFVVGAEAGDRAWVPGQGIVTREFVDSSSDILSGSGAAMIETDAQVSQGSDGGPVFDARGAVVGLTVFRPGVDKPVAWHISVKDVRGFVEPLPSAPEGVPFDAWDAGLTDAARLGPQLTDLDQDGQADTLQTAMATVSPNGQLSPPVAVTLFVDLEQRPVGTESAYRVPAATWGAPPGGRFAFNIFITTRRDGLAAVGYTDRQGRVDEIRLGRTRDPIATTVWRLREDGLWHATTDASSPLLQLDSVNVAPALDRLQRIVGSRLTLQTSTGAR